MFGEKRLSAKELGWSLHVWAIEAARGQVDNLFIGVAPEFDEIRKIPLRDKVVLTPEVAHALLAARDAAAYYCYLSDNLPITSDDQKDIVQGIRDGFAGLQIGDGRLIDFIRQLAQTAFGRFVKARYDTPGDSTNGEFGAFIEIATPMTQFLLEMLSKYYSDDECPEVLGDVPFAVERMK